MIWRSAICFSLTVALSCAASVRGSVTIADRHRNSGRHADLSGTVVWLESATGDTSEPTRHPRLEMVQKDKTFQPHVLVVPVGSRVDFPNVDPIFHNAFSNYNGQIFDIGLYPPGTSRSVRFNREGVVRVFCNIHEAMSAVIVVLRSPYYCVSDAAGKLRIEGVREGRYSLRVYHERATEPALAALSRIVDVASGEIDMGTIAINTDGFAAMPHLNKYGKSYAPAADVTSYPGARQ